MSSTVNNVKSWSWKIRSGAPSSSLGLSSWNYYFTDRFFTVIYIYLYTGIAQKRYYSFFKQSLIFLADLNIEYRRSHSRQIIYFHNSWLSLTFSFQSFPYCDIICTWIRYKLKILTEILNVSVNLLFYIVYKIYNNQKQ